MSGSTKRKNVLAIVLAGGEGKRLMPLTADRAKPAVPFGGIYRLIDFALSNVVNSGYLKVVVLTQYKSHSLDRHVTTTWRMSTLLGNYVTPVPAQQRVGKRWYLGSADAIYQSLNLLTDERPDIVVVVGADHVYRMDFSHMVDQHVESEAGCTVAAIRQPIDLADQFGVIDVDPKSPDRIRAFLEKPKDPVGLPDAPDEVLASMGNYVFDADALRDAVTRDAELERSKHDMGGDIVPWFVDRTESAVYDYKDNEVPGSNERDRGYWRDVGTMRSYYAAHMDLVAPLPVFNLYNTKWPIYTSYGPQPPGQAGGGSRGPADHDVQLHPVARCRHHRRHREPVGALARLLRRRGRGGLRLRAAARGHRRRRCDRAQRDHRQERGDPARCRDRRLVGGRPRARLRGGRRADGAGEGSGGPQVVNDSRAGQLAQPSDLVDVPHLVTAYYTGVPDPDDVDQQVAFGTSGHRGTSLKTSFNETHILATTQAICDYRREQGYDGPLFLGRDTHGLSEPAWASALEVLAANDVTVLVDDRDGYTPTPAVSHAIIRANVGKDLGSASGLADGIVVTPSHNPPTDGGFKYNPPHGGPADSDATSVIAKRANELITGGLSEVRRIPFERARLAASAYDFLGTYVDDLSSVLDIDRIRSAGIRIGADPLGGASVAYWGEIADRLDLDLTVVNPLVDPTWRFMTLDWDGKIRMDCSSPSAMASLIGRKDDYDIATGNDADSDRHGIVTPDAGLMNPNHFLAVAIGYLFGGARPDWPASAQIGKTLVSSSMIDRVAASLDKPMVEVPVGFKWFVPGLIDGSFGFGGEESAGASFLRRDGSTWTTDKDGIILALLASEILAATDKTPSQHYADLVAQHGDPAYARIDAPADREQKAKLAALSPDDVTATELAGEPITAKLTEAPGNGAKIGGLKVTTESAWFAARPSGTEDVYKIYAESFQGPDHLRQVQDEAREVVSAALQG